MEETYILIILENFGIIFCFSGGKNFNHEMMENTCILVL